MKKLLIISAIAFAYIVSAVPPAFAQTASFTYTNLPVNVAAGGTFTIGISVVFTPGGTVANLRGLSYWMFQSNPASGFPFTITNRDVTGSSFNILQSPGLTYAQKLDPISRNSDGSTTNTDLGAVASSSFANGSQFVANLTFSVAANATLGSYTISNTTATTPNVGSRISRVFDSNGNGKDITSSPFTFTVIPEPSTFVLLGLGAVAAGGAFYRRRRLAKSLIQVS